MIYYLSNFKKSTVKPYISTIGMGFCVHGIMLIAIHLLCLLNVQEWVKYKLKHWLWNVYNNTFQICCIFNSLTLWSPYLTNLGFNCYHIQNMLITFHILHSIYSCNVSLWLFIGKRIQTFWYHQQQKKKIQSLYPIMIIQLPKVWSKPFQMFFHTTHYILFLCNLIATKLVWKGQPESEKQVKTDFLFFGKGPM